MGCGSRRCAVALVLLLSWPAAYFAWESAAPWTAPPGTTFPYQGLENDLDRLLQVQASPFRWVSMVRCAVGGHSSVGRCLQRTQSLTRLACALQVTMTGKIKR